MNIKTLSKNAKGNFKFLTGLNRPVTPSQVTKLAESINKMGIIRPIVVANIDFITGKREKYIIDGQHLFHAILRNNMDFPYIEININNAQHLVETIALLNASSKSWSILDYVTSWKNVNKNYIVLEQLFNTYDLELSQIAELLHSNDISVREGGRNSISRIIKRGNLEIRNREYCKEVLDKITEVLTIIPRMDRKSNHVFIAAYVKFLTTPGYLHKEFVEWLKTNKNKFAIVTQDPQEIRKLLLKSIN